MKILWIKTSPLHPLTRGGDLRTFHLLRELHQRHEVTFFGMVADDQQQIGTEKCVEYSSSAYWVKEPKASLKLGRLLFWFGALINLGSKLPYAVARFKSEKLCSESRALLQRENFDFVICDFLFPAASLPWDLKQKSKCPWLLFQHNVETMIWERRVHGRSMFTAWYWRIQRERMFKFEQEFSSRFDGVLTVSDDDSYQFREKFRLNNVLGCVPTGVDLDYFKALPKQPSQIPTVVFMGSMDWYANVDAVLWFAELIWPQILKCVPNARFQIVGRQPPAAIKALGSEIRQIEVTGTVPDVRPYLRSAHVMAVPLRIGGGTRLKIFEAMAAEIPVVSTTIGAEGLAVTHGRHALIADEADDFASAIVKVLLSSDLGTQISQCAMEEVAIPNSWKAASAVMEQHLRNLIAPTASEQCKLQS